MAPDLQALSVSPIRLLYLCCLSVVVCSSVVRSQQHIAVVGAGVHGLLAAIEVKQRGWDVTVFEKESEILPIIPTLDLNGVNYEYYSQSIYSSATFEKSAPNPALLTFASKYNQTLMPWTASAMQHTLYYDTVRGPAPYPAVWEPYFTSVSGVQELVQDLAEAIALLRDVGTNSSVPADLVEAGLAEYNASILDWAQQVQLPAYSSATEVWWYAAECLLPAPLSAAIRLNMDLTTVGGLLRLALIKIRVTPAQAAQLGLGEFLDHTPDEEVVSFFTPTNGVRGLFQAAIQTVGLAADIHFNSPVSEVTNDGMVVGPFGNKQFDHVIVTVRPEAAFNMLSSPLKQVYEGGATGLVDTWVFNASIIPDTDLAANLSGLLLTTLSQNGSLPARDGTPLFLIRQDADLPVYAVASYVMDSISVPQSLGRASAVLEEMGLNITSTIAHQRIPFPSQLAQPQEFDSYESVFLLGEALAGIGLDVALPYVADRMDSWFGSIGEAF